MKKIISLTLFLLLTLSPISLSAETGNDSVTDFFNQNQEESDEERQVNEEESVDQQQLLIDSNDSPNLFGLIVQVVVILALIIGLIYVLLRFFNRSNSFNKQGDLLVNLGGISLGTTKSVQMLKVGEKIFLVGVGDDISILTEITDESTKQQLIDRQQSSNLSANSLFDQLKFKRKESSKEAQEDQTSDTFADRDFASLFKGELETMKEKRAEIRDKRKEEDKL